MGALRVLSKDRRVYSISSDAAPAYVVEPGETFVVETQDAMDGQIPALGRCVAEVDASRANPMTGPIAIAGARPGQTVALQILEIAVDAQGWMSRSPVGIVNPIRHNLAEFVPGVVLPVRPMIGVLGVAPAQGSYTGRDATPSGGNYDLQAYGAGATVFFRVQAPGALVVMGDVHALQADGECSGTGIEIGARITLRAHLLEEGLSAWPYFYRGGVLGTAPWRPTCATPASWPWPR
ncbi:MAG: acetamidase/formamidase family protein [Chloroflexota bacterium]